MKHTLKNIAKQVDVADPINEELKEFIVKLISEKGDKIMSKNRFEVIEKQGKLQQFQIIRDNQTGVLYMTHIAGAGMGLTVMVDQDGKPLLDVDYLKSDSN